jgi:hypothetical protein
MKDLLTAIMTKITTGPSALYSDVGGRVYLDQAPEGTVFPYVVIFIVSGVPADNFTDQIDDLLIQFSLFSESASVTEISTMYADLKTLFDNVSLAVTGCNMAWMKRENLTTITEDITTVNGNLPVKHWAVDYRILLEKS